MVAQLDAMPLSQKEKEHVARGGRVFVVEEIAGPLWHVLAVEGTSCRVLLKPDGMDGYSSQKEAAENALAIASLSNDTPLVRC